MCRCQARGQDHAGGYIGSDQTRAPSSTTLVWISEKQDNNQLKIAETSFVVSSLK